MAKTWQVPTGDDLWQVVSREVVEKADEDLEGGTNDSGDFNGTLDTRADKAVEHAVAEVRGAIEEGGRFPISVTAGAVPPNGVQHTLAIAAFRLAVVKPGLLAVVMNEGGVYAPINQLLKDAKEWIACLKKGCNIVLPLDPTGADYIAPISTTNPAISGIKWGDNLGDDDEYAAGVTDGGKILNELSQNMLTDEAPGVTPVAVNLVALFHLTPVGTDPNNLITASPGAIATDANGATWIKTSGVATNTGWEQRL